MLTKMHFDVLITYIVAWLIVYCMDFNAPNHLYSANALCLDEFKWIWAPLIWLVIIMDSPWYWMHFIIINSFVFIAVNLQNVASKLSQIIPAFNPSRSQNTSAACKMHSQQFLEALSRLELWAFQSNSNIYIFYSIPLLK